MRVIEIITGYVIFTPAYTYLQIPTENHHEPVSQFKIQFLWQRRTERLFSLVFSHYASSFYRSQNALGGFFFCAGQKKYSQYCACLKLFVLDQKIIFV